MDFLLLLLLGVVAGVVAGLLGLGGGILFTPILFVVFSDAGIDNPVVLTIGSSLFCTFIAAAGSSIRQYNQRNFYLAEGTRVGLLGAAGVFLGKQVITSGYYSEQAFVIFFSLLLAYVGYMFYRRGSRHKEGQPDGRPITWPQASVTGGLGGFVAALAGIGGGGVMVPLMNLWYQKPFAKSVSVSSLAIVFISLSGWVQLAFFNGQAEALTAFHIGYVDFGAAFPLAAGGLLGGFVGALFNLKINRHYLQYAFAVLAVAMAVKLLAEAF